MPLRKILFEGIHVVLRARPVADGVERRIGGKEEDGRAVGRPDGSCGAGDAAGMMRKRVGLAAVGRDEEDLRALLGAAHEEQRAAIRRPSRRRLAGIAAGELHRRATRDLLTPHVRHLSIGPPIGARQRVGDRASIRRELCVEDSRDLREIDEGHPTTLLGADGHEDRRCQRDRSGDRPDVAERHADSKGGRARITSTGRAAAL